MSVKARYIPLMCMNDKRPAECAAVTHATGLLLTSQPLCPQVEQNELVIESYLRRTFSVLLIWMTLPS